MALALPSAARAMQAPPAFAGARLIDRIVTLVEQRATLTVQRLTEGNDLV